MICVGKKNPNILLFTVARTYRAVAVSSNLYNFFLNSKNKKNRCVARLSVWVNCHMGGAQGGQKRGPIPWNWTHRKLGAVNVGTGSWIWDPLQVLLTGELSLQSTNARLWSLLGSLKAKPISLSTFSVLFKTDSLWRWKEESSSGSYKTQKRGERRWSALGTLK